MLLQLNFVHSFLCLPYVYQIIYLVFLGEIKLNLLHKISITFIIKHNINRGMKKQITSTGMSAGSKYLSDQLLEARQQRALLRKSLRHQIPCLQITMNVPGSNKKIWPIENVFFISLTLLQEFMQKQGRTLMLLHIEREPENLAILSAGNNAKELKILALEFEKNFILSPLLDIDVFSENDQKLFRQSFGYPPRRCFVCLGAAKVCAAKQTHTYSQIYEVILEMYRNYKFYDFFYKNQENTLI